MGIVQIGTRDSVSAINTGIQNLQQTTTENLQKAVSAVETGIQKTNKETFSKMDAIAWAVCFFLGVAVCLFIVNQFTVKLVKENFKNQIKELAEEPRKEAEAEAKKILEEARKEANLIIIRSKEKE